MYTLSIPINHVQYTDSDLHTITKDTRFATVPSIMSTYVVQTKGFSDLILNKSLEPMSETPCNYFLHSKSSFNSLHVGFQYLHLEHDLPVTKFLNFLYKIRFLQWNSVSEGEVKSISHIISEKHFFHCFLLLSGILHLFNSEALSKTLFLKKTFLPFFKQLSKSKLLFFCFFLNLKAQYLSTFRF